MRAVEFPNENHLSRFARLLAAVKKRRFARYNIGHVEIARLQAGNGGAAIRNFGEQKREGTAASGGPISKLEVNQPGGVQLIDCGDFLFAVAITEAAKSDLRRGLSMRLDQTNIANLRYRPARQAVPHAHRESIWQRILARITARRPLIRSWLDTAQAMLLAEGVLRVRFGPDQSIAVESLARPNNQRILDELASEIVWAQKHGWSWRQRAFRLMCRQPDRAPQKISVIMAGIFGQIEPDIVRKFAQVELQEKVRE